MHDLVIVGGGPAGLATALFGRQLGLDCVVIERRSPPIDKPCGEGIMPSGVKLLREMGVSLPQNSWDFNGIRYVDGDETVEGSFFKGKGIGIRRTRLHEALIRQAEATGCTLCWETRATGLVEKGVKTDNGTYRGRWIVGADGLHSRVRQWANLDAPVNRMERYGLVRHYLLSPWTDKVEVYWHDTFEVYVTPVGTTEVCVAVLTDDRERSFDSFLEEVPRLAERLSRVDEVRDNGGWGPLYRTVSALRNGKVCLVGDAAGYRDAITGEGLSVAFEQARVLAKVLARGTPSRYERRYDWITRTPFALIESLLILRQWPGLRRRLISTMGKQSRLFSFLVTVNDRGVGSTFREALNQFSGVTLGGWLPG